MVMLPAPFSSTSKLMGLCGKNLRELEHVGEEGCPFLVPGSDRGVGGDFVVLKLNV